MMKNKTVYYVHNGAHVGFKEIDGEILSCITCETDDVCIDNDDYGIIHITKADIENNDNLFDDFFDSPPTSSDL